MKMVLMSDYFRSGLNAVKIPQSKNYGFGFGWDWIESRKQNQNKFLVSIKYFISQQQFKIIDKLKNFSFFYEMFKADRYQVNSQLSLHEPVPVPVPELTN